MILFSYKWDKDSSELGNFIIVNMSLEYISLAYTSRTFYKQNYSVSIEDTLRYCAEQDEVINSAAP